MLKTTAGESRFGPNFGGMWHFEWMNWKRCLWYHDGCMYFEWMNWKMWMWYHDCCMQEMQHTLICAPWMCNAP